MKNATTPSKTQKARMKDTTLYQIFYDQFIEEAESVEHTIYLRRNGETDEQYSQRLAHILTPEQYAKREATQLYKEAKESGCDTYDEWYSLTRSMEEGFREFCHEEEKRGRKEVYKAVYKEALARNGSTTLGRVMSRLEAESARDRAEELGVSSYEEYLEEVKRDDEYDDEPHPIADVKSGN